MVADDLRPCPQGWDYENAPNFDALIKERTARFLALCAARAQDAHLFSKDIRPFHAYLFGGLTPDNFPYFAGNYRGAEFRCLIAYRVHVPADGLVGHQPTYVAQEMNWLASEIAEAIKTLDFCWSTPNGALSRAEKLFRLIEIIAAIFVLFLTIHPFANGNGHAARAIVILIALRYGVRFRSFPIHPRPPLSDYSSAISRHRRGDKAPLEQLLISCI